MCPEVTPEGGGWVRSGLGHTILISGGRSEAITPPQPTVGINVGPILLVLGGGSV